MDSENSLLPVSQVKALTMYDEKAFVAAQNRILEHKQSVLKFQAALIGAECARFDGDYTLGRISHNYFSNCTFEDASLKGVAGAGCIFSDVDFINTDLSNSFFQSSTLEHCTFNKSNVSMNMSSCYAKDTHWKDCKGSPNLTHSNLVDCSFRSSKPGNMGECCLDGVFFENLRLTNLNLEFCHFKVVRMKDVVLPFSQMPYIFGGLDYILNTKDSVRISSHINEMDSITIQEYKLVLKDMEVFYSYLEEYFPLSNILIALGKYEEALASILHGIQHSALQRDFRMCKYYCKLITLNGEFSMEQLSMLYNALCQAAPIYSLTESQYFQYSKHMPEIRTMLIDNPQNFPHSTIRLETETSFSESHQVMLLLNALDEILHLRTASLIMPNISLGHNSDLVVIVNLCGTSIGMLAIASLVFGIIATVCKGYNEVATAIINTQTIGANKRQKNKDELEERKLAAEISRLEMENSELRAKHASRRRQISESGLVILRADFTGQDFNPYDWLNV